MALSHYSNPTNKQNDKMIALSYW